MRLLHYFFIALWLASASQLFILYFTPSPPRTHVPTSRFSSGSHALPTHVDAVSLDQPLPYASWAHGHFIQLHWSQHNDAKIRRIVSSYITRNISVDCVVFDVMWMDVDHMFRFDTARFANEGKDIVGWLHNKGIRVMVWWSSLIPVTSRLYGQFFSTPGFFLIDSKIDKPLVGTWSHSDAVGIEGSLLDFSNPDVVLWVEEGFRYLLGTIGVDGVRCGGVDAIIISRNVLNSKGYVTREAYSNMYYWYIFDIGRKIKGFDFLTMSKGVDSYKNFVFVQFAPRDVSFTHFSGEHLGTEQGLRDSLMNSLHSAKNHYINCGILVCGSYFASRTACVQEKDLFRRWVGFAAGMPVLLTPALNLGEPEILDVTIAALQSAIKVHDSLHLYFTSVGTTAFYENQSVLQAGVDETIIFAEPENWEFLVGPNIVVSPEVTTNHPVWMPTKFKFSQYMSLGSVDRMVSSSPTMAAGSTNQRLRGYNDIMVGVGSIIPFHAVTPNGESFVRIVIFGLLQSNSLTITSAAFSFRVNYSFNNGVVVLYFQTFTSVPPILVELMTPEGGSQEVDGAEGKWAVEDITTSSSENSAPKWKKTKIEVMTTSWLAATTRRITLRMKVANQ